MGPTLLSGRSISTPTWEELQTEPLTPLAQRSCMRMTARHCKSCTTALRPERAIRPETRSNLPLQLSPTVTFMLERQISWTCTACVLKIIAAQRGRQEAQRNCTPAFLDHR